MKKQLTEDEFINKWLGDYHNTDLEGVKKAHPEWLKDPDYHSSTFYKEYAVTQEQHDEWYEWAIKRVMKHYNYGKKYAEKMFCIPYLNVSPSVK